MARNKGVVFGVGINDADYKVNWVEGGKNKKCRFYATWAEMIRRCYDPKWLIKRPTYAWCTVCDDWLYFSNFKAWMEQQDWQGKQLDKDIIFKNNKVYSPDTCAFVCSLTNSFVTDRKNHRGDQPLGVYLIHAKTKNKFVAQCRNPFTGERERIGYYPTAKDAHKAYMGWKEEIALEVAEMQSDERVKAALIQRYKT